MAVPVHLRATAIMDLGIPAVDQAQFSINLHTVPNNSVDAAVTDFKLENAAWGLMGNAFATFISAPGCKVSNVVKLVAVKLAIIKPDPLVPSKGIYATEPRILGYATAGATAHQSPVLPQAALKVTCLTNRYGPTGKGGFYLPMPVIGAVFSDGFKIPLADANAVRDAARQLLVDLTTANVDATGHPPYTPCIVSSKGYSSSITRVRCGRVMDTIRSRRNALVESPTAEINK